MKNTKKISDILLDDINMEISISNSLSTPTPNPNREITSDFRLIGIKDQLIKATILELQS